VAAHRAKATTSRQSKSQIATSTVQRLVAPTHIPAIIPYHIQASGRCNRDHDKQQRRRRFLNTAQRALTVQVGLLENPVQLRDQAASCSKQHSVDNDYHCIHCSAQLHRLCKLDSGSQLADDVVLKGAADGLSTLIST
jgi:hypothetical protein